VCGCYIVQGEDSVGAGVIGCVFINISNMGLCKFVWVSFICSILLIRLYMWKRSNMLNK
jgi:hypothetical protein